MPKFIADDNGVTMLEYSMLAAILTVSLLASIQSVRDGIIAAFTAVATTLNQAATPPAAG